MTVTKNDPFTFSLLFSIINPGISNSKIVRKRDGGLWGSGGRICSCKSIVLRTGRLWMFVPVRHSACLSRSAHVCHSRTSKVGQSVEKLDNCKNIFCRRGQTPVFRPYLRSEFSDFFGGVSVDFAEHPAEELVVGKSVLLKELHDGFIPGDQIMIKMGDPHPVHML